MADNARCQHCGGLFPEIMISQHEAMCMSNPDNAEFLE